MTQAHEQYDAIIIGVGQAGNPLATALSQAGWKNPTLAESLNTLFDQVE
jgi:pyruvate/2-oxoglutarate dehydrogenase complex dihydrolipoamide dehydrogenase (E3) component